MTNTTALAHQLRATQRLAYRLEQAIEVLRTHFPLDPDRFDPDMLPVEVAMGLDAFRTRFADLQDMLGRTTFRSLAMADEDESPGQELTTRERIALMERRGILDAAQWRQIREVRNQFAHEYPDDHGEKAANLNAAWQLTPPLLSVAQRCAQYAREKHGVTSCG
ncbi:hypothetical protein [Halorhodospira halochloris]|uniref:hypothetical protein n=1 Tax=Halorhodospira halochloris TaxID=1052 RepID=UPI001EE9527F|nr:hypothetical protein [Halorhodospira halochloris]MCG5549479.1 hypothetical protein [Halorhodospira halochloris]